MLSYVPTMSKIYRYRLLPIAVKFLFLATVNNLGLKIATPNHAPLISLASVQERNPISSAYIYYNRKMSLPSQQAEMNQYKLRLIN